MQKYKNTNGNSGVISYEINDDSITVEFANRSVYIYTNESTGRENIDIMKALARKGKGLSTFISRHVKTNYASQLR